MTPYDPERALTRVKREFGEHGGVCPSIERSSTFTVMEPWIMPEIFAGLRGPDKNGCFLYSRHFNPTVDVLARYLAAMEGTEFAACTASGMAAISGAILQLCHAGDHIVAGHTIYGGTYALLHDLLPQFGVTTTFVNPANTAAFGLAARSETRVFFVETLANPTLRVADIPALADLAHEKGAALVVDNTFTPMVVSPAVLGADVVVHSLTKFINGASDLIAGAICARREFIHQLMDLHTGRLMLLGPTMDPRVAFDVIQRLPHLAVRMREHGARALALAQHLRQMGVPVSYPGLPDHPQHELFTRIANPGYGCGGIVSLDCGAREKAEKLLSVLQNQTRFGLIAVSLGYYDTLMSCSGSSTSSEIPPEDQATTGLTPGLIRISVGYSGALPDQIEALEQGLNLAGIV
ncbi:MAG: aminotransferase class I/II-fold pyridoxal phosphate-dependent enzyme [Thermodesulfobacteriota bacterium]